MHSTVIAHPKPDPADVFGPYSQWPRRHARQNGRKVAVVAATAAFAGVFLHCVAPMIA